MTERADVPADLLGRLRAARMDAPALARTMRDLGVRLRYALRRRASLRSAPEMRRIATRRRWREGGRVVLVAATILLGVALGDGIATRVSRPLPVGDVVLPPPAVSGLEPSTESMGPDFQEPSDFQGLMVAEVNGPEFFSELRELMADAGPAAVFAGLPARDALEALRAQFRQRFSREERREALAASGADPDREDRIQDLARTVAAELVAAELEAQLRRADSPPAEEYPADEISPAPERTVFDLALGLRALLAAGSSRAVGEHRQVVRDGTDALLVALEAGTDDEVTASILAALSDVAVVSGGKVSEVVRRHASRLAANTLDFSQGRRLRRADADLDSLRPALLHWQTRTASLADAGQVLALAPAFGAPATTCARARRLILRHLEERLTAGSERPDVIAAMLYGFGDLVDRDDLDRRLKMWRPQLLLPNYVALYHYAWGQYPLRPGWTQFQQDLRWVTAQRGPEVISDTAALLLTLAMNFAAPGAPELMLARR